MKSQSRGLDARLGDYSEVAAIPGCFQGHRGREFSLDLFLDYLFNGYFFDDLFDDFLFNGYFFNDFDGYFDLYLFDDFPDLRLGAALTGAKNQDERKDRNSCENLNRGVS